MILARTSPSWAASILVEQHADAIQAGCEREPGQAERPAEGSAAGHDGLFLLGEFSDEPVALALGPQAGVMLPAMSVPGPGRARSAASKRPFASVSFAMISCSDAPTEASSNASSRRAAVSFPWAIR